MLGRSLPLVFPPPAADACAVLVQFSNKQMSCVYSKGGDSDHVCEWIMSSSDKAFDCIFYSTEVLNKSSFRNASSPYRAKTDCLKSLSPQAS